MENVQTLVAPKIGLTFHSEKEYYDLKVSDKRRPDLTITCKCMVGEGGQLEIYENEENEAINELVRSAVIDPDVKGGLRWPLGKQTAAERFRVIGSWHTKGVALKSSTMRLILRHADRFDFMSSIGEVSTEVSLILTEIARLLKEGDMETIPLEAKVQEVVKLFWDHLLSCIDPTST